MGIESSPRLPEPPAWGNPEVSGVNVDVPHTELTPPWCVIEKLELLEKDPDVRATFAGEEQDLNCDSRGCDYVCTVRFDVTGDPEIIDDMNTPECLEDPNA